MDDDVTMNNDVAVEVGSLTDDDPAYDLFSDGDGVPSLGVSGTFGMTENIGITAGWHRARRVGDDFSTSGNFESRLRLDEISLGARAHADILVGLRPYVELDAMLLRGGVRFDDDPSDDDNPGEVRQSALAPGLLALGGLQVVIPDVEPVTPAIHLAAGWGGALTPLQWDGIGELTPRGFVIRAGLGVAF